MAAKRIDESVIDVGRRLKALRAESGLALRQLAERSGVAFTTIQKIESGSISPTIGILMKIAGGLGVRMTSLLEEESQARHVHFVRKNERIRASVKSQAIEVQYVAQKLLKPEMFGFHITVGPGEGSGSEPLSHPGEEMIIGVQGKMTFLVGEERYSVAPGDCLHFKCDIPHTWMNTGARPAKFYLICSESSLEPAPPDRI